MQKIEIILRFMKRIAPALIIFILLGTIIGCVVFAWSHGKFMDEMVFKQELLGTAGRNLGLQVNDVAPEAE